MYNASIVDIVSSCVCFSTSYGLCMRDNNYVTIFCYNLKSLFKGLTFRSQAHLEQHLQGYSFLKAESKLGYESGKCSER